MIKTIRKALIPLSLTVIATTSPPGHAMPEQALVPGGVAIIDVGDYTPDTRITFDNRKTTIFRQGGTWYALAGIPLKAKTG